MNQSSYTSVTVAKTNIVTISNPEVSVIPEADTM